MDISDPLNLKIHMYIGDRHSDSETETTLKPHKPIERKKHCSGDTEQFGM